MASSKLNAAVPNRARKVASFPLIVQDRALPNIDAPQTQWSSLSKTRNPHQRHLMGILRSHASLSVTPVWLSKPGEQAPEPDCAPSFPNETSVPTVGLPVPQLLKILPTGSQCPV